MGGVYEGAWAYDKRNGHGTMVYRNGDKYTGTAPLRTAAPCQWVCNAAAGMWFEDTRHGQVRCVDCRTEIRNQNLTISAGSIDVCEGRRVRGPVAV